MSEGSEIGFFLVKNFAMVSIQMLIVYLNIFLLIPYFFLKKKYILYCLLSGILVYLFFIVSFPWIERVVGFFHFYFNSIPALSFPVFKWKYTFWAFFSGSVPYSLSLIGSLAYRIYQQNQHNEQITQGLIIEKAKAELQYLRSQINPHFLFNSLNNIHSLVLLNPQKAAEYSILLSDLLRYMLYEVKKEQTTLEAEVQCVKDYFSLVGFRIEDTAHLKINVDVETENLRIPPLLLLSFVENGVKHSGIEYDAESFLKVSVKERQQQLELRMENSVKPNKSELDKAGIGLENLNKRLELNYPDQFDFSFNIRNEVAYTKLSLNLKL